MVMFLVINVITESLGEEGRRVRVIDGMTMKWRSESMKRPEDSMLLALTMEKRVMSQRRQAALENCERQEEWIPPGGFGRNAALPAPRLQSSRTHLPLETSRRVRKQICVVFSH